MSMSRLLSLALAMLGLLPATPAFAMGTSFTYQGTLEDAGQPANGSYDFQFKLINSDGVTIGTQLREAVAVSGGVFTVVLDFGFGSSFPGNFQRFLEIGIRPGSSTGGYQLLSPLTPIRPAPYALRASAVTDGSIAAASIASGAVTTAKLADGAVTSAKLTTNAVTTAKLANGAVTNDKIAEGSLTTSRMAGTLGNFDLGNITLAARSCNDYNVNFGGDVRAGDFPLIAMQAGGSLPPNFSVTALRVPADNLVQVRICNAGPVSAFMPYVGIRLLTHR